MTPEQRDNLRSETRQRRRMTDGELLDLALIELRLRERDIQKLLDVIEWEIDEARYMAHRFHASHAIEN